MPRSCSLPHQSSSWFHSLVHFLFITLSPVVGAQYCDQCVCLCVRLHLSRTASQKVSVRITCGGGLILLGRQCNTSCTSRFVDGVMFSYNGANGLETTTCACRQVRQMAAPGAKSAVTDCILFAYVSILTPCCSRLINKYDLDISELVSK